MQDDDFAAYINHANIGATHVGTSMQVYLVGGAVRDQLLGNKPRENDYVVVGSTPDEMKKQGYKQVGKDFPVFLHPKTHEEYALARTERKSGKGYHGFSTNFSPTITLEEDLMRRDLTINAIAQDESGHIIDPYHGQDDLKNQVLKHVSDAFVEDPLRVLRVARFQAMLPEFNIDQSTMAMMQHICNHPDEMTSLSHERIWIEILKASQFKAFDLFWSVLDQSGCLSALNIKLDCTKLSAILNASKLEGYWRLSACLWQQPQCIPSFLDLNPPGELKQCLLIILNKHETILNPHQLSASEILQVLRSIDPFRRPERAEQIMSTVKASSTEVYNFWTKMIQAVLTVDTTQIAKNTEPKMIAQQIETARINAIKHLL